MRLLEAVVAAVPRWAEAGDAAGAQRIWNAGGHTAGYSSNAFKDIAALCQRLSLIGAGKPPMHWGGLDRVVHSILLIS